MVIDQIYDVVFTQNNYNWNFNETELLCYYGRLEKSFEVIGNAKQSKLGENWAKL